MMAEASWTSRPAALSRGALADQRDRLAELGRDRLLVSFDRVAKALPRYLEQLNLSVVAPLFGAPSSPNVLRRVIDRQGRDAVLKLIPGSQAGEAATLERWTAAGVAVPPLLQAGFETYAAGSRICSWVSSPASRSRTKTCRH